MDSKTKRGISRVGVTTATMRRWCKAGFGFRLPGGHWRAYEARVVEIERCLSGGTAHQR